MPLAYLFDYFNDRIRESNLHILSTGVETVEQARAASSS